MADHPGRAALAVIMEAAEKATPGPWYVSGVRQKLILHDAYRPEYHSIIACGQEPQEKVAAVWYEPRTHIGFHDALFIARSNPAAIASVAAYVADLEAERDAAKAENARLREAIAALIEHDEADCDDDLDAWSREWTRIADIARAALGGDNG